MASVEEALRVAFEHHGRGRHAEAEVIYGRILAAVPDHPDTLHLAGILKVQTGRAEDAVRLLRSAVTHRPDSAVFRSNLANALLQARNVEAAVAVHRTAIALKPEFAESWSSLSSALIRLDRRAEASPAARRAVALDPGFAVARINLGLLAADLGRTGESTAALRAGLALEPSHADALYALGRQTAEADGRPLRWAAAMAPDRADIQSRHAAWRSARATGAGDGVDPDTLAALAALADANARSGKPDDAFRIRRRLVALHPADVAALLALAGDSEAMGEGAGAITLTARAQAIAPADPATLNPLVDRLDRAHRHAEVIELAARNPARFGLDGWLLSRLADALDRTGDRTLARRLQRRILVFRPDHVFAMSALAEMAADDGKDSTGVAALVRRGIALDPPTPDLLRRALMIATSSGDDAPAARADLDDLTTRLHDATRRHGWFWKTPYYEVFAVAKALRGRVPDGALTAMMESAARAADAGEHETGPWIRYLLGVHHLYAGAMDEAAAILDRVAPAIPMARHVPPLCDRLGVREGGDRDTVDRYEAGMVWLRRPTPDRSWDSVVFAACDAGYLERFAPVFAASADVFARGRPLIHLHVVDPTERSRALIDRLAAAAAARSGLAVTAERYAGATACRHTYLTCARFLRLPAVMAAHRRPVLIADIDGVFLGPPEAFLDGLDGDHVLLPNELGILAYHDSVGAALVGLPDTPAAAAFARRARDILLFWMTRGEMHYSLDQIALRQAAESPTPVTLVQPDWSVGVYRRGPGRFAAFMGEKGDAAMTAHLAAMAARIEDHHRRPDEPPRDLARDLARRMGYPDPVD